MTQKEKLLAAFQLAENTKQKLLNDLSEYDSYRLSHKPDANTWSVAQIVQHLAVAEKGAIRYLQKKLEVGGHQKARFSSIARLKLLNTALALPIKFKAPQVVAVASENEIPYETAVSNWNAVRTEVRKTYESLDESVITHDLFKHPFAGKLDLIQGQRFMQQHMERHLKQIWRVIGEQH
jgi:hypothetical protein